MSNLAEQNLPYVRNNKAYISNYPVKAPLFDSGGTTFNVKSYGALGNGTGDDSVAINAAIKAAQATSTGGQVFLPPGKYQISSPLAITASNIWIVGAGNSSQIWVNNSANLLAAITIQGTGVIQCAIKNLYINGNNANQSNGDGIYIKTPWSTYDTHHVIEDVYIQSCKNNGIEFGVSGDTRVIEMNRVRIKGCGGHNMYIPYPSITDSTFYDIVCDLAGLDGFYIGGANCHFTDCKAFYNGVAATIGTGYGFQLVGYTNYFNQCEAQDNYQAGFYGDNTGDATYGSFGCTFVNCIADSNGQTGTAYGQGLWGHNVKQWQVIGGSFMNRAYGDYDQQIGILWDGTAANNIINGATFYGNEVAGHQDLSTGGGNLYFPGTTERRSEWSPQDHNYIAWAYDPSAAGFTNIIPASGTLNMVKIYIPTGIKITNLVFSIATAGSGLTSGQNFAGLYSSALSLLSGTADQTTAWASTGIITMALTTAQTVAPGYYYVGFYSNGTTLPTLRTGGNAGSIANAGLSSGTYRYGTSSTSLTTALPSTAASVSATVVPWWVAVS